ncbi:hypothetical protein [Polaromonas sp.]|uniref:hypothetical protein n=1 Tax=Polaromonas sp. TaxID=1869339 RepID=UPI00356898A6
MALAAATFFWHLHGLGHGLELTDESFYLLSSIHADNIRLFFTPWHWIGNALWQVSGSIVAFRAVGLGLVTASAVLLAWGMLRAAPLAGMNAPVGRAARWATLSSAASGALLYGSLLSFTPSYNLLSASGACFAMGLGLLSMTYSGGRAQALAVLAGAALGITILCKFSAGLGVAGLLLGAQAALARRQRARQFELLLLLASVIATVALTVYLKTGFEEAIRQFRAGIEIVWFAQGDKTTVGRVIRSATDVASMLANAILAFWGPLACFVLGLKWKPKLLGSIGLAWFAVLLVTNDHLTGGMSRYTTQALPLVGCLALALLASTGQWLNNDRSVLLCGILLALPFAVALGTWNPLQIQIMTALAPWGAIVGLLGFSSQQADNRAAWASVLFGTIVLFQVIGSGDQPYRMHPIGEQTHPVSIDALGTVKVDAKTARLVKDIQVAARQCGIAPGAPFLDFYNLPGVALILGAVPVDTPWLLDRDYAAVALRRADVATLQRAVIAVKLDANQVRPESPPQLASFPRGFKLCGRAKGPLDDLPIELWAPV